MNLRVLLIAFGCLAAAPLAGAADWPQWRGLARNSFSPEPISTNWPASGPKVLWRANVGTGFSSISICQGRAYTMGNHTNEDTVWCFDARNGTELWKYTYPAQLSPQWYEGGPGATPTVCSNRVFTISKWGDVFCFESGTGKILWARDLRQEGTKPNRWGFAGSPLIWRNLVILNAGEAGTALDFLTGRTVWSNGTNPAGYASPLLLREGERELVLIFAAQHLVALEPGTGHERWRFPWKTDWDTNNTDPLLWNDCIFITSFSHGCGLLSLRSGQPEAVYETKALFNNLSAALLLGDCVYGFSGEAKKDTEFRCVHLPTGTVKWSRKDPAFGSVIAAGNTALVLSETGELLAGDLTPAGFDIHARAKVVGGRCWTPPALANGCAYLRNAAGDLVCLDLRPGVQGPPE